MDRLTRQLLEILGRHLDLTTHRVFFFGSRAAHRGHDRSDVDLGIEGPKPVDPMALVAIQEEIECLPTLYTIQVVDFRCVDPQFRDVALQHIEPLAASP